jgi:hypothetical protein
MPGSSSSTSIPQSRADKLLAAIQQDQARLSAEQHHQTDLARETLIKTNLALQQLDAIQRVVIASPTPPVTSAPIDEARIAAVSPLDAGPCPYKGLERFEAKDAEWFYGRTRLVAKLIARLSETPFLAVLGPSGSGKSSVLHAGLLPAVWSGLVPGADAWQTITFTPGAHPLEELASRVALLRRIASGSLLADLTTAPSRICLAVRQALLDRPANARGV